MMYDMLELHHISGAHLLNICMNQVVSESKLEVLDELLGFTLPTVIRSFLPLNMYEESHFQLFELLIT